MELLRVPIEQIDVNPWNPNRMNPVQMNGLKESLRKFPQILEGQRIIVWKPRFSEEKYQILNGEHRYRASLDLVEEGRTEFATVPIGVVTDINEAAAKLISLTLSNCGEEDYEKKTRLIISIKNEISLTDIANTIGADQMFMNAVSRMADTDLNLVAKPMEKANADINAAFDDIGGLDGLLQKAGVNDVPSCDIPELVFIKVTPDVRRCLELAVKEKLSGPEIIQLACKARLSELRQAERDASD